MPSIKSIEGSKRKAEAGAAQMEAGNSTSRRAFACDKSADALRELCYTRLIMNHVLFAMLAEGV